MQPSFAKRLDICIQKIDIGTQKINGSHLKIFGMAINIFEVQNKAKKSLYFEKIMLLVDIIMNIALGMSFLILSNIKIIFAD